MTPGGETEGAIRRIHAAARRLQSLGRHGDTVLAHITPAEAELLHKVTDGGSINPVTGLPEFFLGDFFTGLSNGFSGIGESFMSGLSSFSDGLSGLGDSLSGGLGDAFSGIGDSIGDGPTGGLGKASDSLAVTGAKPETPNLLTDGGSINPVTGLPEFFLGDFFTGLSNGFSGIGDGIGDGFKNLFGDNGLSDSTVKATDSVAATKLERPNLLEDTLKPAEPVFRDKVLRPEDRGGPRFAPPPEPKPVRAISAHNAFGAGRKDKAWGVNRTSTRTGNNYHHRGADFVTKTGEGIKASVSGEVIKVGTVYAKKKSSMEPTYQTVDIKTADGYIVRHFCVSPELKEGDMVKAGKTTIGSAQDLTQRYPGITNHVHVEVREPKIDSYTGPQFKGVQRYKDIRPVIAPQKR